MFKVWVFRLSNYNVCNHCCVVTSHQLCTVVTMPRFRDMHILQGPCLQWRKCLGEGHDFYVVLMAGCASIVLWVELGLVLLF